MQFIDILLRNLLIILQLLRRNKEDKENKEVFVTIIRDKKFCHRINS